MSRPQSWLLAQPTAFAALSRGTARGALLLVAALLLASLLTGPADISIQVTAVPLPGGIVDGLRHGGDYYALAADALRSGGAPTSGLLAVPLPALGTLAAALPPVVLTAMLWTLAAAVAIAWTARLRPELGGVPTRLIAILLTVAGTIVALTRTDGALTPGVWAGLFTALALALRRPGRGVPAIALVLAAALVGEGAGIALLLMAALAWREDARGEAAGWLLALGGLALVVAVHLHAVAQALPFAEAGDASDRFGFGGAVQALVDATALGALPRALAAPLTVLGVLGWAARRDPRPLALLVACTVVAALSSEGEPWALLAAPLIPLGLVFVPDAIRDLLAAALDRRRITVRRVAP